MAERKDEYITMSSVVVFDAEQEKQYIRAFQQRYFT